MTSLILTVIGLDRPGLVGMISQVVSRHGGNWLESRMAKLAGQFAGIVHITVDEAASEAVTRELSELRSKGLMIDVTRTSPESDAADEDGSTTYELEFMGHDRPGLVHDIASALAARRISVIELETFTLSAPMSGEAMFKAVARLQSPADVDSDELQQALDQVADHLDLDLSLTERSA